MTVFCLVRHAATDILDHAIAGRLPNIHLSQEGRRQAEQLGDLLQALPLSAIYSSPLERAVETAAPLALRLGLSIQLSNFLQEVDYGAWTGIPFSDLAADKRWQAFNSFRSRAHTPGGESLLAAQERIVTELRRLRARHPHEAIGLVTHAEPIRLAICHYAGFPLDFSLRIEISPASVSTLAISEHETRLLGLNRTSSLEVPLAEEMSPTRHADLSEPGERNRPLQ